MEMRGFVKLVVHCRLYVKLKMELSTIWEQEVGKTWTFFSANYVVTIGNIKYVAMPIG
jgi:hypothetical protein